jgi:hypothetical protein
LVTWATALTGLPSTTRSARIGGGRDVVIPDAVVDELVVPDALAGRGVEADEALGEQVVPGRCPP